MSEVANKRGSRGDAEALSGDENSITEKVLGELADQVLLLREMTLNVRRDAEQRRLLGRCLPLVQMWQSEKERTGEPAEGLQRLCREIEEALRG